MCLPEAKAEALSKAMGSEMSLVEVVKDVGTSIFNHVQQSWVTAAVDFSAAMLKGGPDKLEPFFRTHQDLNKFLKVRASYTCYLWIDIMSSSGVYGGTAFKVGESSTTAEKLRWWHGEVELIIGSFYDLDCNMKGLEQWAAAWARIFEELVSYTHKPLQELTATCQSCKLRLIKEFGPSPSAPMPPPSEPSGAGVSEACDASSRPFQGSLKPLESIARYGYDKVEEAWMAAQSPVPVPNAGSHRRLSVLTLKSLTASMESFVWSLHMEASSATDCCIYTDACAKKPVLSTKKLPSSMKLFFPGVVSLFPATNSYQLTQAFGLNFYVLPPNTSATPEFFEGGWLVKTTSAKSATMEMKTMDVTVALHLEKMIVSEKAEFAEAETGSADAKLSNLVLRLPYLLPKESLTIDNETFKEMSYVAGDDVFRARKRKTDSKEQARGASGFIEEQQRLKAQSGLQPMPKKRAKNDVFKHIMK